VTLPITAQHEVRLTHVSQTQWDRNAPHLVTMQALRVDMPFAGLCRLSNDVTHMPEHSRLDFHTELRMRRELLRQCLREQVIQRIFERRTHRGVAASAPGSAR